MTSIKITDKLLTETQNDLNKWSALPPLSNRKSEYNQDVSAP